MRFSIFYKTSKRYVSNICIFGVTYYFVRENMFQIVSTSGFSMQPTVQPNQILFCEHFSVKRQKLSRGDIVILKSPEKPAEYACKRLAGVEGDVIDGIEVPRGHVWVAGDNTSVSTDSRDYGPVSYGLLIGKIIFRVWPIYAVGTL